VEQSDASLNRSETKKNRFLRDILFSHNPKRPKESFGFESNPDAIQRGRGEAAKAISNERIIFQDPFRYLSYAQYN
jgi:hypothetical protein